MALPATLPWRSRFTYGPTGTETDFTLEISARPFVPVRRTVGGSRTAAGGVPAGYVVRIDNLFNLPLRFRESERPTLEALLAWAEIGEEVTWYPDAADTTFSYQVYIEAPKAGTDDFAPTRHATYGRIFEATLILRFAAAAGTFEYYEYNA